MANVKTEPRTPLTDINNNVDSPPKTPRDSSVVTAVITPKSSPRASPKTSPKIAQDSDCDDEIKDDVDTDEEQVVPKGKRPPGAVRRRNERERNRVKHINRTFSVLRQHLPSRKANKKLSKVETLRSAVDYIKHLRQLLADHDSLTAAISLEQALIAHNHQQQLLQHHHQLRQQHQQQQQQYHNRLGGDHSVCVRTISSGLQYPPRISSTSSSSSSLNSSLCSPTGPVQSPSFCGSHPVVSPTYTQPELTWEQTNPAADQDQELLKLAAEAGLADMDLW